MVAIRHFIGSLAIALSLTRIEGTGCSGGVWSISNASQANELAEALACSESAQFIVSWNGKVELECTLAIGNDSTLTIMGVEDAVIAGGGELRLFSVSGSSLNLNNTALEGGWAQDGNGGAIFADSNSNLTLHSCNLVDSSANFEGGES